MKEFSEFENPEKKDYDLTSNDGVIKSINDGEIQISKIQHDFLNLWIDLGMPEDYELEPFGITEKELCNPTKQTLAKLREYEKTMNDKNVKQK